MMQDDETVFVDFDTIAAALAPELLWDEETFVETGGIIGSRLPVFWDETGKRLWRRQDVIRWVTSVYSNVYPLRTAQFEQALIAATASVGA